jgi:hypothetical protein
VSEYRVRRQHRKQLSPAKKTSQPVAQTHTTTDPALLQRAQDMPESLSASDIMQLQRLLGNQKTREIMAQSINHTATPHDIQRLFGKKKKKQAEISGPFDVKKMNADGEMNAFDKTKVKDEMGYAEDPQDVQPNLSFEDLKARAKVARNTNDPLIKAQFLEYFSTHYAPHLTGEIEYFQFLAQKVAYMDLQPGDLIGANVDTESGSKIDKMLEETDQDKASDEESQYSKQYVVESKYSNEAGLNAFLILPSDGDTNDNAIVLFRGTGKNKMGGKRGEASGALADTDYGGVGRVAFYKGLSVMKAWLQEAKKYNRITISGHSLGGAMAERFYSMASKQAGDKLRLLTYQGAAIDRISTVGDVMGKDDPQKKGSKATRVVARGDVVPLGGMAHVPGQKVKYSDSDGGKFGMMESHLQIKLVEQQLNEALEQPVDEVTNVISKEKKGGTNFTKTAITAGKHLGSLIAHSFMVLSPKHLYKAIRSGVKDGVETT